MQNFLLEIVLKKGIFKKKVAINVRLLSPECTSENLTEPPNNNNSSFITVCNDNKICKSIGWVGELNQNLENYWFSLLPHIPDKAKNNLLINDIWGDDLRASFNLQEVSREVKFEIIIYVCYFKFRLYKEIIQEKQYKVTIRPKYSAENKLEFQKKLLQIRDYIKDKNEKPRKCFISYAWEEDERKKTQLKEWLNQFKDDLVSVNLKVFFDLDDMTGDFKKTMHDNIDDSDFIFIICTPRYKSRIEVLSSGANLEFNYSTLPDKQKQIILIIYEKETSDDLLSVLPEKIKNFMAFDFTNNENYFKNMIGYSNPKGIIPTIYKFFDCKPYEGLVETYTKSK